jgi:hypothetical protein
MRRGLRRSGALVAAACGLSSVALHADLPPGESGPCALVTRDLRGQIEAMKQLKAQGRSLESPSKKHWQPESPEALLARDRQHVEALNAMLPGMGCASLDIDRELAKPLNSDLLPPSHKPQNKHHKR